jgi:hypothetical protein
MEQRKFQRFSDNFHVLFSSDTVKENNRDRTGARPLGETRELRSGMHPDRPRVTAATSGLPRRLGRRRLRRRLTHAAYCRLASTHLIGRLTGARLTARKHSAV